MLIVLCPAKSGAAKATKTGIVAVPRSGGRQGHGTLHEGLLRAVGFRWPVRPKVTLNDVVSCCPLPVWVKRQAFQAIEARVAAANRRNLAETLGAMENATTRPEPVILMTRNSSGKPIGPFQGACALVMSESC